MLISNFPDVNNFKFNNNLIENYDASLFIPYGPKCYIWFTNIENNPKCILIDINKDKTLSNGLIKNIRFNNNLTNGKGTILHCVKNNKTNIIIEDIIMYKGNYINTSYKQKLFTIKDFFCKNYKNDEYNELNISLAWIRHNINDENINIKIPYDIYAIKYFSLNSNKYRIILNKNDIEQNKIKHTFIIKNANKCELYELYILNKDNQLILYDYALINDLHTSNNMKKIFKDNPNSEFIIKCTYNKKYKGWIPTHIIKDDKTRISNVNELRKYPSNYL